MVLSSPHRGGYSSVETSQRLDANGFLPRIAGVTLANKIQWIKPLDFLPRIAGVTLYVLYASQSPNSFPPRIAGVTPYRHVTIKTKGLSSPPSGGYNLYYVFLKG